MELLLFLFGLAALLSMIFRKRESTETKIQKRLGQLSEDSELDIEDSLEKRQVALSFSSAEQIRYLKERDEKESHALIMEAQIQENSAQPDNEGYFKNTSTWWGNFDIKTRSGETYHGRIKILSHHMISIKEQSGSKVVLSLKDIVRIE